MSMFSIRVVLHGANEADYLLLHIRMDQAGFSRLIDGIWLATGLPWTWRLPPAMYGITSGLSTKEIHQKASVVAATVGRPIHVFVCRWDEAVWTLQPVDANAATGT